MVERGELAGDRKALSERHVACALRIREWLTQRNAAAAGTDTEDRRIRLRFRLRSGVYLVRLPEYHPRGLNTTPAAPESFPPHLRRGTLLLLPPPGAGTGKTPLLIQSLSCTQ